MINLQPKNLQCTPLCDDNEYHCTLNNHHYHQVVHNNKTYILSNLNLFEWEHHHLSPKKKQKNFFKAKSKKKTYHYSNSKAFYATQFCWGTNNFGIIVDSFPFSVRWLEFYCVLLGNMVVGLCFFFIIKLFFLINNSCTSFSSV